MEDRGKGNSQKNGYLYSKEKGEKNRFAWKNLP